MKILVTGANGLVGKALCSALDQAGDQAIQAVRISSTQRGIPVGDLHGSTDWERVLSLGIDSVVHLAGKTSTSSNLTETEAQHYRQINTLGTAHLARKCAAYGVKRFLFISTIKVLGEGKNEPYREGDLALPADNYAVSKWEAEQSLWQIAAETGMEVVVVRPPLIYGPGVKGNFLRLMQAIDNRAALPLGAIQNRRSLIYLGNLVNAIQLCLTHAEAPGKTYLVSDDDDVSTPELIRRLADAMGCRPFLIPVPVSWMRWAGALLGKSASVERLTGSLSVDTAFIRKDLGWAAPHTMQSGLAATAQWYRINKANL